MEYTHDGHYGVTCVFFLTNILRGGIAEMVDGTSWMMTVSATNVRSSAGLNAPMSKRPGFIMTGGYSTWRRR